MYKQTLLALFWLSVAVFAQAAPLVEIDQPRVQLSLAPYIDILEDPDGNLTIENVMSDRYSFQFAPAPMTEMFFGYTDSAYWIRFTIENQRDNDMAFILEASPADIDYIDIYEIDPQTSALRHHHQTGSAFPYTDREYNYPLYLFDMDIEAHGAYTYYLRVESNKTLNLELQLATPHEYMHRAGIRDWWQGLIIGSLLVMFAVYLCLFYAFRFKGFLWYGLFLCSVMFMQMSWNGYLLQFFRSHDLLLDRQIMSPVYLAILFSCLFAQSLLGTRKRARWQHIILGITAAVCLVGSIVTWFVQAYFNSMCVSTIAILSTIFVFGFTLFANMEGHQMARHFLLARTVTTGMILIAIFNTQGYLPQGSFAAWGLSGAIVLEGIMMALSMSLTCLKTLREKQLPENTENREKLARSLVNLSDVCHELRTPISGVLGMADLLLDGNLTEQQRNQIRTVRKSGLALLDVTNKISDLSSIEMGNVELSMAPFELNALVESSIENCRSSAESNNIELIYNVDGSATGYVRGDQEKLRQIIINLLQFTLRHLEQGEAILTVVPGIAGEFVFTIRSGHNTLLERSALPDNRELGSSDHLNITIAEQYIKLMGGSLSVTTHIDGGSTIRFNIQLASHESSILLPQDDNTILMGKQLLVVDDNATCCTIIEQQAVQWGLAVQSTHTGKEALALLRSRTTVDEPFDIVLVDYDMPGMNGLELIEHIQNDQNINSKNLVIIMLTGVSMAPSKVMAENARIARVLYKPVSGKSLKQTLQSVLKK
ncbi:MAG TPA: 7TM-DISM domain-containing protein [Pseudomonadales bacterium]|nr:7TM-DISM domain-containing protein [Pseudomonadales bacterium]